MNEPEQHSKIDDRDILLDRENFMLAKGADQRFIELHKLFEEGDRSFLERRTQNLIADDELIGFLSFALEFSGREGVYEKLISCFRVEERQKIEHEVVRTAIAASNWGILKTTISSFIQSTNPEERAATVKFLALQSMLGARDLSIPVWDEIKELPFVMNDLTRCVLDLKSNILFGDIWDLERKTKKSFDWLHTQFLSEQAAALSSLDKECVVLRYLASEVVGRIPKGSTRQIIENFGLSFPIGGHCEFASDENVINSAIEKFNFIVVNEVKSRNANLDSPKSIDLRVLDFIDVLPTSTLPSILELRLKSDDPTILQRIVASSSANNSELALVLKHAERLVAYPQDIFYQANLELIDFGELVIYRRNMNECNLCGANLSQCVIAECDFTGALYDSATKFPDDFDPKRNGMIHYYDDAVFEVPTGLKENEKVNFDTVKKSFAQSYPKSVDALQPLPSYPFGESPSPWRTYHNLLAALAHRSGKIGEEAVHLIIPVLLTQYPQTASVWLTEMLERKQILATVDSRRAGDTFESELMLLTNHPRNPSFDVGSMAHLTKRIAALRNDTAQSPNISGRIVGNWGGSAILGHGFLRWRHDCESVSYKNEVGEVERLKSLVEQFHFIKIGEQDRLGRFTSRADGMDSDFGAGFASVINWRVGAVAWNPKAFDAFIELRRGYLLYSTEQNGTLLIRNSSRVYGRNKLRHAAYWGTFGYSSNVTAQNILSIGTNFIENKFYPLINVPAEATWQGVVTELHIANLLAELKLILETYAKWKFDTDPKTAFTKDGEMIGGFHSPGFIPLLDFLEAKIKRAGEADALPRERHIPQLAFINPNYVPWLPYGYHPNGYSLQSRLKIDLDTIKVLREIALTGKSSSRLARELGIRDFFQEAGFKNSAELIML